MPSCSEVDKYVRPQMVKAEEYVVASTLLRPNSLKKRSAFLDQNCEE